VGDSTRQKRKKNTTEEEGRRGGGEVRKHQDTNRFTIPSNKSIKKKGQQKSAAARIGGGTQGKGGILEEAGKVAKGFIRRVGWVVDKAMGMMELGGGERGGEVVKPNVMWS